MTKLNTEQLRAVNHRDGPMLVLAGPGSGKTAVLVNRVLHLVKEEHVDPHSILVLTFSRAAAEQMQDRFYALANASLPVSFGTFHAIFYHILKSQGLYRKAEILTLNKKTELMKRASVRKRIRDRNDPSFIIRLIELADIKKSGHEEELQKADDRERDALTLVFDEYNRLCIDGGYIDFGDMISDCLKMLKSNDKILKKWQDRYKYILVDEFQDIDKRQYDVLMFLAGPKGNVFCVGDDDQSIYSFRGADPKIMKRYCKENKEIKTVRLKKNYRCPGQVIEHAGRLIKNNSERFEKSQIGISDDTAPCIEHRCFRNSGDEALYCLSLIRSLKEMGEEKETVGILYRISRSGDIVENILKKEGISYVRKDKGINYYDNDWVKDVMAYLRLTVCDSREDMFRIINRPNRYLDRECIGPDGNMKDNMLSYYPDDEYRDRVIKLFGDIDFIKELDCLGAVNYILRGIGLLDHFRTKYGDKYRGEEWEEATEGLLDRARAHKSINEWLKSLDRISDDLRMDESSNIELRTIHGAKGLEYDNVIMIGLQEGVFPLKKCDDRESLEEERRLFYVGMTRCRKRLWLMGIQKDEYGKRESRFIKEAGLSDETLGSIIEDMV